MRIALSLVAAAIAASPLQARLPEQTSSDEGKKLFERHCAVCHGIEGSGGRGPSLRRAHLSHAPTEAALRTLISDGLPPDMPDAWFLSEEDIANVAAYVRSLGAIPSNPLPGNSRHGAEVYAKNGCPTCHTLAGSGHAYGPELTDIGERRSASYIREKLLHPATALEEGAGGWTIDSAPSLGFLLVEATTNRGETIRGVRLNEDSFTIQIKDSQDRFHTLRKDELRDLRKLRGVTAMPSYQGVLTDVELQDLVAYLAEEEQR